MIISIVKSKIFWLIIILLAGTSAVYFFNKEQTKIEVFELKKGNIIQDVSATGNITATKDVDLAFEANGKLSSINVSVGEKIKKGDVLMSLSVSELLAQQKEAESALETAKAKLSQLFAGTRLEEIRVYEDSFSNARNTLLNNEKLYLSAAGIALSTSKSVVDNTSLSTSLSTNNPTLAIEQTFLRQIANSSYLDAQAAIDKADSNSSEEKILAAYDKLMTNLKNVQGVLEKISAMLENTPLSLNLTQDKLDSSKSTINTQRSNISTAIVNLASTKASFDYAKNQLNLEKAGPTKEAVDLAQSQVQEAEDHLNLIKAQIAKSYITAPFDGLVGKTDAKVGEYITTGKSVISLVSTNNFQIEADITEIDIPKIRIGNDVNITFDAFSKNLVWQGAVVEIESSHKTVEGVVYYKTTIDFKPGQKLQDIKSGMSANIDIIAAEKKDILILPQRLVSEKNGHKFVNILKGAQTIKQSEVKTGLSGGGMIEIISGAKEGDKIVIDGNF